MDVTNCSYVEKHGAFFILKNRCVSLYISHKLIVS